MGNQAAFIKVHPTIWTQDLKRRQQLDSSMSLTFSLELLLGNPKDFGPWDFLMEPGARSRGDVKNPRIREADWDYRVSTPLRAAARSAALPPLLGNQTQAQGHNLIKAQPSP